jgi:membrane fusion protein (multidrug efflux system)
MNSLLWSICISIVLISCSGKTTKEEQQTYLVIQPEIKDTKYEREYAASINSFQNVEIRTKVRGYVEEILVDEGK